MACPVVRAEPGAGAAGGHGQAGQVRDITQATGTSNIPAGLPSHPFLTFPDPANSFFGSCSCFKRCYFYNKASFNIFIFEIFITFYLRNKNKRKEK